MAKRSSKSSHVNPEDRAVFTQRGYFPPEEQWVINFGVKAYEFYKLLIKEWVTTGQRIIVHGRLMALARQTGYRNPAQLIRDMEARGLLVPLLKQGRREDGPARSIVARPFVGRSSALKTIQYPDPCFTKGVSVNEQIWCLPGDVQAITLSRTGAVLLYELLLDMIEGTDGNRFAKPVMERLLREYTYEQAGEEIGYLCKVGCLRKWENSRGNEIHFEVIARPYVVAYSLKGRSPLKVPEICQPSVGLGATYDAQFNKKDSETSSGAPIPFDLSSVPTEEILLELRARIELKKRELVEQGDARIAELSEEIKSILQSGTAAELNELRQTIDAYITELQARIAVFEDQKKHLEALEESLSR